MLKTRISTACHTSSIFTPGASTVTETNRKLSLPSLPFQIPHLITDAANSVKTMAQLANSTELDSLLSLFNPIPPQLLASKEYPRLKHAKHYNVQGSLARNEGCQNALAEILEALIEKQPSRARELHLVRKNIVQIDDNRRVVETVMAEVELELLKAKKIVKDLTLQMEESNSTMRQKKQELHKLNKGRKFEERENHQCAEVVRELESAKKEIEEANEEIVLVELAQIEAIKELVAIEAQREEEAQNFSSSMEKIRNKISNLMEETDNVKDLEVELAITSSNIQQLQNELNLNGSSEHLETSSQESLSQSRAIKEELEAAKKEEECKHVSKEMARTKRSKEKLGKSIQNLHVKLLTAKDKLEVVSVSEGNATAMLSSLSLTLNQLKESAESTIKESELINAETASMKSDVWKTLSKIDLAEERLQSVVQELEAVKSSEMIVLDKLRSLTENASRARALAAQHHSTISISRFEYEYLRGCAASAKEIADRKVPTAESIPPNGHFVSSFHEEPFSIPNTLISTHHEGPIGGMLVEDVGRSKDLRNWCPSATPFFNQG
ncbi:hypothetical protein Nepgr_029219 [Nepenthes gracilis]|uniref:Uncharacterized protein n=1 Tax=Nepenthes gracilis TaxID=150966 RepID=A0AAD3Y5B8_NEPGR|nr:hypothetical protein Nepgr_029219 [Nepenthes gracilis]